MQVESWLMRAAAARPHALAVQTPAASCTYAALLADARVFARALAARGADPGERVAIALPPGLEFASVLHACMLLGAIAVPVDLRMSATERATVTAGTRVLVDEALAAQLDRKSVV